MIYVFDDGKIVESGTFSQLTANGGKLAEMWKNYQVSDNVVVTDSFEIVESQL